jgi:hypothetical protein
MMIAQARRRTAHLGLTIAFDTGDAASLPYDDASFDVCRAETEAAAAIVRLPADPRRSRVLQGPNRGHTGALT